MLVVVDGVFSMEGDIAPLPAICDLCERFGARLMVDEAHAAGVLGARGAGTAELFGVEDRVDLRMGTFSKSLASCGGFMAGSGEVVEYLRIQSRAFLFTAAAVPAAVGAALAALRIIRSRRRARRCSRRCSTTRATCATASRSAGSPSVGPSRCPRAATSSRRSCPCSSATTGRPSCCGRRSSTRGVFVNTALHPAVPPGGALLRTSVMATHDRGTLDRALEAFSSVKERFEADHGALPGPGRTDAAHRTSAPLDAAITPFVSPGREPVRRTSYGGVGGNHDGKKKGALSECCARSHVDRPAPSVIASPPRRRGASG